ncbi:MAG: regulatory signaling modulator protein AmpE [Gammaproteobacteria bacterium]|nr:regulatory signaling modulator protein AmpE [Gammaproteobacteria bacterium]MDH5691903.1 regulatory signaling modulator protein AmpE [Gammaproteobacteria bacterium]
MTLLAIVLALVAERFLGVLEDYRRWDWLDRYLDWLGAKAGEDGVVKDVAILGLGIFLPALLLYAVVWSLGDILFLFELAAGAVILVYCLGPKSFYDQVKEFCASSDNGNQESAIWYLESILGRTITQNEARSLNRTMAENLFVLAHERIFALLFWFLILGPFGAVVYRALRRASEKLGSAEESKDSWVHQLAYLAAWPSSRLLSIIYGVTGNFVEGVAGFKNKGKDCSAYWTDPNDRVLVCSGSGAIGLKTDQDTLDTGVIRGAIALIRRSILFFVGLIALMTLSGWMV